jgi:hypothetical protein
MSNSADFILQPFAGDSGKGFIVERVKDEERLAWDELPVGKGIMSFPVAGTSHRPLPLQDPRFAVGRRLALIADPKNPYDRNAIGVWSGDGRVQVGFVPADLTARVRRYFGDGFVASVMGETWADERRVGIRAFLMGTKSRVVPNGQVDGF